MLSGFFINITILVSFIFLFHRIFYQVPLRESSSLGQKLFAGVFSGVLGLILLTYSIPLSDTTIIDLRMVPITLMAIFGGWIPTTIAGLIIVAGRLVIGVSISSVAAIILIIATIFSCLLVHKLVKNVWIQAAWMVLITNTYIAVTLDILLPPGQWLPASGMYLLSSILGTAVAVYMFTHLTQVNELFRRYQDQAYRDGLTSLYNKRAFQEMIQQTEAEYTGSSRSLSLLVLDIDHFKSINDTYGHSEGDVVLTQLSEILERSIRSNDLAFRVGGEEFTILLHDCTSAQALIISERIRLNVEEADFHLHQIPDSLNVTVSVGVSTYPETEAQIQHLYDASDEALYQAKRQGRNRVCFAEATA